MEEYENYAENMRKIIVKTHKIIVKTHKDRKALNVPLFNVMLVNEPDEEIRVALTAINNALDEIPVLHGIIEIFRCHEVTTKSRYKNLLYLSVKLSLKIKDFRDKIIKKTKYGNCGEYSAMVLNKISLVCPSVKSIYVSSTENFDHVANLIQIKDQFYLIDKWLELEIRRITMQNYHREMPLDLLISSDYALTRSEFLSRCYNNLLIDNQQKLVVARRIVESFYLMNSNDITLHEKLVTLVGLIKKLELGEVPLIKADSILHNELEFIVQLFLSIKSKVSLVQFDELDFLASGSDVRKYINQIVDQSLILPVFLAESFFDQLKKSINNDENRVPNLLYESDYSDSEVKICKKVHI